MDINELVDQILGLPVVTDPIVHAFEVLARSTLKNDEAILAVVQALAEKVSTLERRIDMLMELHIIPNDEESLENQ